MTNQPQPGSLRHRPHKVIPKHASGGAGSHCSNCETLRSSSSHWNQGVLAAVMAWASISVYGGQLLKCFSRMWKLHPPMHFSTLVKGVTFDRMDRPPVINPLQLGCGFSLPSSANHTKGSLALQNAFRTGLLWIPFQANNRANRFIPVAIAVYFK